MTDAPAPAVEDVPTSDAGLVDTDGIILTKTGWVRVTIAGTTYRLRRPFMGEFRDLRTGLAEIEDQLGEEQDKVSALLGEVTAGLGRLAQGGADAPDIEEQKAIATRARKANRDLLALAEDLRQGWWEDVFEMLCVDKPNTPADWPSWVGDVELPVKVVAHWRAAPLAPGH